MNSYPQPCKYPLTTIKALLDVAQDQLPSYIDAQAIFDDDSAASCFDVIVVNRTNKREYKYKPIFMHRGQQVAMTATYSIRQAKKLIYWYLRLFLDSPDSMTDIDDIIDAQLWLSKDELDKVLKAINTYGYKVKPDV
jgi:hypothetical protein